MKSQKSCEVTYRSRSSIKLILGVSAQDRGSAIHQTGSICRKRFGTKVSTQKVLERHPCLAQLGIIDTQLKKFTKTSAETHFINNLQ